MNLFINIAKRKAQGMDGYSYWRSIITMSLAVAFYTHAQETAPCCQPPSIEDISIVLQDVPEQDIQILLNLLYWSYQRSHITLKTQAAAEKTFHEQWTAWQSCANRRLNPNTAPICYHKHVEHARFEELQKEFHAVHSCYADIVAKATSVHSYASPKILAFVRSLREKSRQHVMHTIKQQLKDLSQHLEQKLSQQAADLRCEHRGLMSYLMNQIAVASFAQLDESWRVHSNQLMTQFFSIQELFNSIWTAIETTRSQFYATYFKLIHSVMREKQFSPSSFTNIVTSPYETSPSLFELSITY